MHLRDRSSVIIQSERGWRYILEHTPTTRPYTDAARDAINRHTDRVIPRDRLHPLPTSGEDLQRADRTSDLLTYVIQDNGNSIVSRDILNLAAGWLERGLITDEHFVRMDAGISRSKG